MQRRSLIPFAVIGLAAMLALFVVKQRGLNPSATSPWAAAPAPALIKPAGTPTPPKIAKSSPAVAIKIGDQLQAIAAQLRAANDPATSRRLLAELRAALEALPPTVASAAVQAYLTAGEDAPTKLDVTIKPGGGLGDASSLRVFLMDFLGQVDLGAAGRLAQTVLAVPTSPDEWAVSLRNYAWSDATPAGEAYLQAKAREMIGNAAWRQQPSAGFLEAFDVIVYARGFDLAPQLTELVRNHDNRAVAHAAYLTLDRLTLSNPAAALAPLAAQPDLMKGREQTRANFFARADVREPAQQALVENYLLDPGHAGAELQTFAGLYPNANYMISNNLLTTPQTPDRAELTARDRAALAQVETWLADPRFETVKPQLEVMHQRLATFVKQAAENP